GPVQIKCRTLHFYNAINNRGTEFCNPLVILKIPSRDSNVSILDQSIKAGTKHEKVIIGLELTGHYWIT
ncbi:MAG: hypothetical protein AB2392_21740, partial [Neobacillus sp.]